MLSTPWQRGEVATTKSRQLQHSHRAMNFTDLKGILLMQRPYHLSGAIL
jgi:hypothetical protein